MTRNDPAGRAPAEAASWCARLNNRSVSTAELEEFYAWRREPANAAAYAEAEGAWRAARALGSESDIGDALAEVLGRPVTPRPWWRGWRFQLGLAVSGLVACLLGVWMATKPLVLETGVGEQRLVRLADGSRVRLDTHSRIEIRLRSGQRDVLLARGQAFFEVAKDAARPFLVSADGSSVRALGTRFGVRTDSGSVSVVLDEGSVRVAGRDSGTAMLRPGQMVVVGGGRVAAPVAADVEAMTSWTAGRLVFRDTPLVAAIAEMNRYSNAPIVLDPARAGVLRVNGVFDTGNSESFVAAASAISGLRVEHLPGGGVRLAD
jgi:transmembrane sensor